MRAATVTTILGLVLISGALLAATATSTGGNAADSARGEFDRLDRNRDERIDRAEVRGNAEIAKQFAELDGDSDGMLEWREFLRREDPATSGS